MPRRKSRPRKAARKKKTWILCLEKDDPEKELEFEVRYRQHLSRAQLFRRMLARSISIAKMLTAHGHQKTSGVFQLS